jgi:hypothetical protein
MVGTKERLDEVLESLRSPSPKFNRHIREDLVISA